MNLLDDLGRGGAATAGTAGGMGGDPARSVWLNYNPAEYKTLNVSPDIKDLFKHITKYPFNKHSYVPQVFELETQLKPFIPEYIPAIGEVDAFIKVPRPDGDEETLGISIVDEYIFG